MSVVATLRSALESGDTEALAAAYAEDAVLDASLPGGRRRLEGREAIAAALEEWLHGPARLTEFTTRRHPEGYDLWVERVGEDGASARQRHYLHSASDSIERHWIYAAPPRIAPAGATLTAVPGDAVLAELGDVARLEPMTSTGWSGAALWRIELARGERLVSKRVDPEADWLSRATGAVPREALLHADGVFARMPRQIDPVAVAATLDEGAWWVTARDVGDVLVDPDSPIPRERNQFVMRAANAMWEEFWDEQVPHLCTLSERLRCMAPSFAEVERDGHDLLPKQVEAAWEAFAEVAGPELGGSVLALVEDPAPLVAALEQGGTTLLHSDLRDENMGFDRDRLVLLDWGLACQGHPVVELAWYMMHNGWRTEATHDEMVEDYRSARGEHDDPRANELLGLTGLVLYGWILGHSAVVHPDPVERGWAREELEWWVPQAQRGLERLEGD